MESLHTADWLLIIFAASVAVTGLFRGFSGTVAFIAAFCASAVSGTVAWNCGYDGAVWIRSLIVLVVSLLVFGLVRVIVRKCVNGLLAQPADSLLGFLSGVAVALMVAVAWAYSGFYTDYSLIVSEISSYVGVR